MSKKSNSNTMEDKPKIDLDKEQLGSAESQRWLFTPAIWIAIITVLGTIIVALINNFAPDFFQRILHRPTISISNDIRDTSGQSIDINSAPFQVKVSGTVSDIDELFVYLIVVDKNHHHIQPKLGPNVGNSFSNICYLGEEHNPAAYGQQYTIYAVVTDKSYEQFKWFEGESYIAKSNELIITREQLPIPTTTP